MESEAQALCETGLERFPTDGVGLAMRQALTGGKRLRAALVLICSGKREAALAVEDFHAASLIADDLPCMDDALERRGRPALHHAFDEETALLASYGLIAAGYEQLALTGEMRAIKLATRTTGLGGLVGGQFLDLQGATDRAEELLAKKTGALFELAIGLGWITSGGHPRDLDRACRFGRSLGIVFQILDDQMDREDGAFNLFNDLEPAALDRIYRDAEAELRSDLFADNQAMMEMVEGMLGTVQV